MVEEKHKDSDPLIRGFSLSGDPEFMSVGSDLFNVVNLYSQLVDRTRKCFDGKTLDPVVDP